jgi:hypothetical protein
VHVRQLRTTVSWLQGIQNELTMNSELSRFFQVFLRIISNLTGVVVGLQRLLSGKLKKTVCGGPASSSATFGSGPLRCLLVGRSGNRVQVIRGIMMKVCCWESQGGLVVLIQWDSGWPVSARNQQIKQ